MLLAGLLAGWPSFAWHGWGEEAFARAREEKRPVLLLVGEGACPRCRAAEADLSEPETAALLGRQYVAVRVDRDERPDVADIYASAAVLLAEGTGDPGLPFAIMLTAEARPLGIVPLGPGALATRLAALAADYRERRGELEARAGVTTLALREAQKPVPARGALGEAAVHRALRGLAEAFDAKQGGFGASTRMFPAGALRLLFAEHARAGNTEALSMATAVLEAHGPGPRLDENALLLAACVRGHEATGRPAFRERAEAIASWARRRRAAAGGFRAGAGEDEEDERVFAGANGLMIGALAASGSALHRPADLEEAQAAAAAVLARLGPAGGLRRYALGQGAHGSAFLEDYAYLAEGLLDLQEATGESRWRREAAALVETAIGRFLDVENGGFFDTDAAHGPLIVRSRNGYDGRLPGANGIMVSVLLRLGRVSGETRLMELARRTAEAFRGDLERTPRGMETLAAAAGELLARKAAPVPEEPPLPSRVALGPVTVDVRLSAPRARPGERLEARVGLTIAAGWQVNAHGGGRDRLGLAVSLPGTALIASPPCYPEGSSPLAGDAVVVVALRVPPETAPGGMHVRLRVVFQACRGGDCRAPESALVEAPLAVAPAR